MCSNRQNGGAAPKAKNLADRSVETFCTDTSAVLRNVAEDISISLSPKARRMPKWLFFPTYSALPPRHQASLTSGKRHPRRWKEPARGTLLRLCYGARLALFHTMRMQQRRRFKAVSFTDNPNADGPTTSQAFAGASRNFEPYSAPWHRAPPECRDKSVQTL